MAVQPYAGLTGAQRRLLGCGIAHRLASSCWKASAVASCLVERALNWLVGLLRHSFPLRVVQDGPGVGDARALEGHGRVAVAVGSAKDFVPAAAVSLRPAARQLKRRHHRR